MTGSLNVLVIESEQQTADEARHELRAAGHNVLSCHEAGVPAFPCNALVEGRECPLSSEVVDVALVVRARPRSQPAPREDGVTCVLRQHVPLVVAGSALLNPFDEYATEVVERGAPVVAAVERAAAEPLPAHTKRAAMALREVLDRRSITAAPLVAVYRRNGALLIEVTLGPDDSLDNHIKSMAAVRMTAAVREIDTDARGVDVAYSTSNER